MKCFPIDSSTNELLLAKSALQIPYFLSIPSSAAVVPPGAHEARTTLKGHMFRSEQDSIHL